MSEAKLGAMTREELLAIWRGAVDVSYGDPIVEAGDGRGLEAWNQYFAQLARVSTAIDVTTQAMYYKSHSGQSNPPAAGARKATVTLSFARTGRIEEPLVLYKGQVFAEEETTDWGKPVGEVVTTGRRYVLKETLVFHSGEVGPFDVLAEAERVGHGYNNPMVGTIKAIPQVGANFTNNLASVKASVAFVAAAEENPAVAWSAEVQAYNEPDTFIPQHLGQMLLFIGGANIGQVGRIAKYSTPDLITDPLNPSGGGVQIVHTRCLDLASVAGTFVPGEKVKILDGGAATVGYALLLGMRTTASRPRATLDWLSASAEGVSIVGLKSGATATYTKLFPQLLFVTQSASATWRVLDWSLDYGLTCTNALAPVDGRAAMLDALGEDRNMGRVGGEEDEAYRSRITTLADVVAPNAMVRCANRALLPFGVFFPSTVVTHHYYEVGRREWPGFFFDAQASGDVDPSNERTHAYDMLTRLIVTSTQTGEFFPGELVHQTSTGAFGYAVVNRPYPGGSPPFAAPVTVLDGVIEIPSLGVFAITSGVSSRWVGTKSGAFAEVTVMGGTPSSSAKFKTWLSFAEMRAFQWFGVPRRSDGDPGMPYDGSSLDGFPKKNAYDCLEAEALSFDGAPYTTARYWRSLYAAVEAAKGGGVGFDIFIDE